MVCGVPDDQRLCDAMMLRLDDNMINTKSQIQKPSLRATNQVVRGAPEEQRLCGDRRDGAQSVCLPLQVRQFHSSGN